VSDAHRAQLEGNRARLAAQHVELRGHTERAAHKLLELEHQGTDPRLEDRCHALARAIVAIDDEFGENDA